MKSNDSAVAKKDYAGETNTDKIIEQLGEDNAPAAEYCRKYTFKNGKKGYLWSLGEAQDAFNNKEAIDEAFIKIGESTMGKSDYHWTSTQYNYYRAWKMHWISGDDYGNKEDQAFVRAVSAL